MPNSSSSRKGVKFVDWEAIAKNSKQKRFEVAQRNRQRQRQELLDIHRGGPVALGMPPGEWQNFHANQLAERQQELSALAPRMPLHHAHDEKPLGEYLIRRNADDRSIEGAELERLRAANRSVEEARQKLDVGRGNVQEDIQRSGHDSTHRTLAARALVKFQKNNEFPPPGVSSQMRFGQISASSAELTRAGNCGEHGDVTTHVHATRLQTVDAVGKTSSIGVDHAWSELRHASGVASPHDVVMDAWAHGPAILREDSAFAHDPSDVHAEYSYDSTTASSGVQRVGQLLNHFQNNQQAHQVAANTLDQLRAQNHQQQKGVYLSTDVMDDQFVARTNNTVQSWSPLHQQLEAVKVARGLGAPVRNAVNWSESIFPPK